MTGQHGERGDQGEKGPPGPPGPPGARGPKAAYGREGFRGAKGDIGSVVSEFYRSFMHFKMIEASVSEFHGVRNKNLIIMYTLPKSALCVSVILSIFQFLGLIDFLYTTSLPFFSCMNNEILAWSRSDNIIITGIMMMSSFVIGF